MSCIDMPQVESKQSMIAVSRQRFLYINRCQIVLSTQQLLSDSYAVLMTLWQCIFFLTCSEYIVHSNSPYYIRTGCCELYTINMASLRIPQCSRVTYEMTESHTSLILETSDGLLASTSTCRHTFLHFYLLSKRSLVYWLVGNNSGCLTLTKPKHPH